MYLELGLSTAVHQIAKVPNLSFVTKPLSLNTPLETCVPVWTPYQKGAQDDLEKVQRRGLIVS